MALINPNQYTKQFRDVLAMRKGDRAAKLFTTLRDRGSPRQLAQQQHVEVEIELTSEAPDSKEISLARNIIFLAPPHLPPGHGRAHVDDIEARAGREVRFSNTVCDK